MLILITLIRSIYCISVLGVDQTLERTSTSLQNCTQFCLKNMDYCKQVIYNNYTCIFNMSEYFGTFGNIPRVLSLFKERAMPIWPCFSGPVWLNLACFWLFLCVSRGQEGSSGIFRPEPFVASPHGSRTISGPWDMRI